MKVEMKRVQTEEEISCLSQIAEKVWHETYDSLLPPGQTEYMLEKFQSPQAVKSQMQNSGYLYYLICLDGTPGGFVGFAPRYESNEEMFLSKVYLLKEYRGHGAVKKAFALVEKETKLRELSFIRLTVNKENDHAVNVYRHFGFEIADSVVSDIGNGYVMDDYIMIKKIK